MRSTISLAALAAALSIAGCTVAPPMGPTVMALPAQGKSLVQFQEDDGSCRSYAEQMLGGSSPADAANQSAVNSAAVGTVLGAAIGALLGAAGGHAGAGAAIGAGSGLVLGSAAGAGAAQNSAASMQRRYDTSYLQCMAARGESVPMAPYGPPPHPGYSGADARGRAG